MKRATTLLSAMALVAGCRHAATGPMGEVKGSLHPSGARAKSDPTVRGSRLVPEVLDEEKSFGVEPGGGLRSVASGIRVVSLSNGALLAAEDKLPSPPTSTIAVPERMGGGFLFQIGTTVWRADKWLDRARPIYTSQGNAITRLIVGLDRVYVRSSNGAHRAIDPRTGAVLDAGALPATPSLGAFGAMDGWRAVAVADLRGVVATFDAGATWKPLGLPLETKADVKPYEDGLAVGGNKVWYLVRPDGQVSRMPGAPEDATSNKAANGGLDTFHGGPAKTFGKRPLVAAIEDGWPMADGTSVVARDGALARVRLADGALVDFASDAFALKPARCHAIALPTASDPVGIGFVCGEPRGKTVIYGYDAARGRMSPIREFEHARAVLPSGTGAIAVKGPCAEDAAFGEPESGNVAYCIKSRDGDWREVQLQGRVAGERVVALADGKVAIISPPHGELAAARLTVLDTNMNATTVPIVVSTPSVSGLPPEATRFLKSGLWLDGFEERAPGVLGGWVEAAGTFLGLQIQLDGHARAGAFVRDMGTSVVSSRYGLGWTDSRRGYETTDGGMTWNAVDLADRIGGPRSATSRACGPAGCIMAGWVRIGWGAPKHATPEPPPSPKVSHRLPPVLDLACEPTRMPSPPPAASSSSLAGTLTRDLTVPSSPWMSGFGGPLRQPPQTNVDWSPFFNAPAPKLRNEELGLSHEVTEWVDRSARGPFLRFYAWGPKGAEWERTSRWLIRFTSPFGSSQDIVSTQAAPPTKVALDWARSFTGGGVVRAVQSWHFASGDDSGHALLVAKRTSLEVVPIELEADRAPVEIHRADGEPFVSIDASARVGGRWLLVGPPGAGEALASAVWEVDNGVARELVRVPRVDVTNARLARKPDGRTIGLVVDGQPDPDRNIGTRWVLPIDLGTSALGELEPLGSTDFADRESVGACAGDEPGWIVDLPWSGTVRVKSNPQQFGSSMRNVIARVRMSRDRVCVERMSGALDGALESISRTAAHGAKPDSGVKSGVATTPARGDNPTIEIAAYNARARYPLRCTKR